MHIYHILDFRDDGFYWVVYSSVLALYVVSSRYEADV